MDSDKLIKMIKELKRYSLGDDGGCSDPECCGGTNYEMEEDTKGDYFKVKDVIKVIKELR